MARRVFTNEGIIEAIQAFATELGRTPPQVMFGGRSRISAHMIRKHFGSWNEAVAKAGLIPDRGYNKIGERELLEDWGLLARKLGRVPTIEQYNEQGKFCHKVFTGRWGSWLGMPDRFREFARNQGEYADVLQLLPVLLTRGRRREVTPITYAADPLSVAFSAGGGKSDHIKLPDRPVYGMPIDFRGLRHAPANEQGVVFLFGMVARELGYIVESIQTGFPDCEGKRRIGMDRWQRVRIEFEYESKHYLTHGHPLDGCDVVVCWRDNWGDMPEGMECIELISVIRELNPNGR